jgi:hypothetical protein
VAGWAGSKAWITPGLLMAQRRPHLGPRHDRLQGLEFLRRYHDASRPPVARPGATSARHGGQRREDGTFDRSLERDEQFNTRISGRRQGAGRPQAHSHAAQCGAAGASPHGVGERFRTAGDAVDYLMWRMLRVPTATVTRDAFVFLTGN